MGLAAHMDDLEAIEAIGEAISELADTTPETGDFLTSIFRMRDDFNPEAGKPSLTVRYVGIVEDGEEFYVKENEETEAYEDTPFTPQVNRWEVVVYHPDYAPPTMGTGIDGYSFAQEQVERGVMSFRRRLKTNRTLNGLIKEIRLEGTSADDLLDPRTGQTFYGSDIAIITITY